MIENKGLQIISRDDCYLFKGEHIIISTKAWFPRLHNQWHDQVCTLPSGLLTPSLFILSEILITGMPLQHLCKHSILRVYGRFLFLILVSTNSISLPSKQRMVKSSSRLIPTQEPQYNDSGTASKTTIEPKSLVWSDDK